MVSKKKLTCGITMGDPAGIGPEVVLKALQDKKIQRLANFLIIGNYSVFKKTAKICKIKLKIKKIKSADELSKTEKSQISLLDVGNVSNLVFSRAKAAYGLLALECIKLAIRLSKAKKIDVLVTAPVNKHTISQIDPSFRGHTEYLAASLKVRNFVMMLIGGPLKVVLVTRHIALKDVARTLNTKKISEVLRTTAQALQRYFGIAHPRIAVCGLNPHGGDAGLIGNEEEKIIQPATVKAKRWGKIVGPLPADTVFHYALQDKFDAVCAMYHDQGLIPLKMLSFHQGVNLTIGLPFLRTSPDHGTAYDIAGKNMANPGSMKEAIKLAVKLGSRVKSVSQTNLRS